MRLKPLVLVVSLLLLSACQANLTKEQAPSAQLTIQGSDTEVQLVSALVEAFTKEHPDANISVAGGGSAVGIAALINGETDIANSSRQMKPEEIQSAKDRGHDPQEFILARDGLSIIVHPSNPLEKITMEQLSKIFQGTVTNWKDLGGDDAPIVLYGRQSTSGTFGFFRDTVVKGDYAVSMRQMEGSQAIFDGVTADAHAIGYVGVGYVKGEDGQGKAGVKILPVSPTAESVAYSPLDKTAVENETYPIARRIYQYLPNVPVADSVLARFLAFEVSDAGQAVVEASGFYPVIASDRTQNAALFTKVQ